MIGPDDPGSSLESELTKDALAAHLKEVKERHPSALAYYRILAARGPLPKSVVEHDLCLALGEPFDPNRFILVQKWITSGLVRKGQERIDEFTPEGFRIKPKHLAAVRAALAE